MHEKGFVNVDGQLRTNVDHVWAVGDVAATPLQLAHVSFTEGYAVAERIAGIDVPEIDYVNIPRVTYSTPEIASVGLTEAQAVERGHQVVTEKLDFRAIGKANIVGEGGIVKVVAEADGGPVLGIHMIGPHVTDLIAEAMLITNWEAVPGRGRRADPPPPVPVRGGRRGAPRARRQAAPLPVAKESRWRRRPKRRPLPAGVRSPTTGCGRCSTS